jgi:hypothetical protein
LDNAARALVGLAEPEVFFLWPFSIEHGQVIHKTTGAYQIPKATVDRGGSGGPFANPKTCGITYG